MYLVSPTGEEKEKQSMKRRKKKNKQCQGDIAEAEASTQTILQGALPLLRIVHDEFDATVRVIC